MALVNHKIKSKYSYHPETKGELIECIKTELDNNNTNLNCIDTSNITDMSKLFSESKNNDNGIKLTDEQQKTLDVSEWDVYNVEDMNCMFAGCKQFNSDLSKWNVSNVKNMEFMFAHCYQFNSDLSKWNVSKVEKMGGMFNSCYQFNSDLSKWNVSNVKKMQYMFINCTKFNSNLSNWSVSNVKFMTDMFEASGLEGNEPSWYK